MEKQLTQADLLKLETFKKEIDFERPELLAQYGVSVQKNLASFSEKILCNVRNKEASEVGALLNEMMLTVKGIDIENLSNPGLITRVWQRILTEVSLFKGNFEKINDQVDSLIQKLEESKAELLLEIKKLDDTYEENLSYFQDLNLLIEAAEEVINTKRAEISKEIAPEGDWSSLQRTKDQETVLRGFEKRIHDLKLSRTVALQTLPQIRLIQHNNTELVNKIQSSILNTIPVWKNQIVLTLSLAKQKKIAEVQKKVSETTNSLLLKNSHMLKDSSLEIAKMSEEGLFQITTLKKVNDELISTISGILQIYKEGRDQRKIAEKDLVDMESRLRLTLNATL